MSSTLEAGVGLLFLKGIYIFHIILFAQMMNSSKILRLCLTDQTYNDLAHNQEGSEELFELTSIIPYACFVTQGQDYFQSLLSFFPYFFEHLFLNCWESSALIYYQLLPSKFKLIITSKYIRIILGEVDLSYIGNNVDYSYSFIKYNDQKTAYSHPISSMSSEERLRFLLTSGLQFSTEDSKATKLLWKELNSFQRIEILGTALEEITDYLSMNKKLDQEQIRLKKILSLNISIQESLNLGIPNYFCFISQSMREYGINTRFLLNQMTNFNNEIEKKIMQNYDDEVQRYRQMEEQHSQLSKTNFEETNSPKQYSDERYEQNTKIERPQEKKVVIKSYSSMTPSDNNHISFNRKTTKKQ